MTPEDLQVFVAGITVGIIIGNILRIVFDIMSAPESRSGHRD